LNYVKKGVLFTYKSREKTPLTSFKNKTRANSYTMKTIILFLGLLLLLAGCYQTPTDVPQAQVVAPTEDADIMPEIEEVKTPVADNTKYIDTEKSSFEFEGYAPGKSHVGTFTDWEGTISKTNEQIVKIEGTLQVSSIETDNSGLDGHLQSADFFDAENYPTIRFVSTSIQEARMYGTLTFHGVTKQISFPVTVTENSVSAEFLLDTTDFNFKYTAIDKDVRLAFTFSE
jgi:polyisoprenoid-binding protein YceI